MTDQNIDITLNVGDLRDIMKAKMSDVIHKSIAKNIDSIEKQLDKFFSKGGGFVNNESSFETGLDWALEQLFKESLNEVLVEMDYKNMVKERTKELLSDGDFIKSLAEQKVKRALGL